MKLKHTLALAALACIGTAASAANTTDWGPLGPVADIAYVTDHAANDPVDDVYSFSLTSTSDVDAYAEEFESRSVSLSGATFELFSGTFGAADATAVGTPFSFSNTATETVYSSLATGAYFFEVKGSGGPSGSAYDFEAFEEEPGGSAGDVPEPASAALLLAGIGMMGFLGRRRRN
jgi:hypothetical protein